MRRTWKIVLDPLSTWLYTQYLIVQISLLGGGVLKVVCMSVKNDVYLVVGCRELTPELPEWSQEDASASFSWSCSVDMVSPGGPLIIRRQRGDFKHLKDHQTGYKLFLIQGSALDADFLVRHLFLQSWKFAINYFLCRFQDEKSAAFKSA